MTKWETGYVEWFCPDCDREAFAISTPEPIENNDHTCHFERREPEVLCEECGGNMDECCCAEDVPYRNVPGTSLDFTIKKPPYMEE